MLPCTFGERRAPHASPALDTWEQPTSSSWCHMMQCARIIRHILDFSQYKIAQGSTRDALTSNRNAVNHSGKRSIASKQCRQLEILSKQHCMRELPTLGGDVPLSTHRAHSWSLAHTSTKVWNAFKIIVSFESAPAENVLKNIATRRTSFALSISYNYVDMHNSKMWTNAPPPPSQTKTHPTLLVLVGYYSETCSPCCYNIAAVSEMFVLKNVFHFYITHDVPGLFWCGLLRAHASTGGDWRPLLLLSQLWLQQRYELSTRHCFA